MRPTYRVVETGEIGQLVACPCDDPVILEFKDKVRDAFHLRELEPTTAPISMSDTRGQAAKNGQKGRSKGIEHRTIKRMLQIHAFLMKQTAPVYRKQIEDQVGFNITRHIMIQKSGLVHYDSLESLGIVKRIKGERTWAAWQLTEHGRTEGEQIIKSLQ